MDKTSEKLLETRCFKEFSNLCLDLDKGFCMRKCIIDEVIFFYFLFASLVVSCLFRQSAKSLDFQGIFVLHIIFFGDERSYIAEDVRAEKTERYAVDRDADSACDEE